MFSRGWNKNGRHIVSTIPQLYLLRIEKFAKGNSFDADFRHEEETNMKGESVL